MGATGEWSGWIWEIGPSLHGVDRESIRNIDDLIPKADWFWGPIGTYCVPRCCGVGSFDVRTSYLRYALHLTETPPPMVKGVDIPRIDPANGNVDELADEFEASAELLDELEDAVVVSTYFNEFFHPTELAAFMRHLVNALTV